MEDSSPWADPSPPPIKKDSLSSDTDIWGKPSAMESPMLSVHRVEERVQDPVEDMEDIKIHEEMVSVDDKPNLGDEHMLRNGREHSEKDNDITSIRDINQVEPHTFDATEGGFEDAALEDEEFAVEPFGQTIDADDDFGDFGDFDQGIISGNEGFEDVVVDDDERGDEKGFVDEPEDMRKGGLVIKPLQLDPLPSRAELVYQIQSIISSIFDTTSEELLTDEPIRQVDGLNQILTTESSRETYAQLTTPPIFKPLDWKRSRARREHLVALGIPVNLDEVESHHLKALPPLRITTSMTTAKRGQSLDSHTSTTRTRNGNATAGPSRLRVEPRERSKTRDERSLGEKPDWNRVKSERLLEYREDQLSLVPPKYLERMQEDLVEACSNASSLLAWLRQLEEVRKDDNKRKNEQIADLISKAQRLKASEASSGGGGLFRKGSQKRHSGSGYNTPHRTGSPSVR